MNLILLTPEDFTKPDTVCLTGRRCTHIMTVLQATLGQQLKVGVVGGLMGQGIVRRIDSSSVELQLDLNQPPPPPLDITLLLALPRPKVLKRILQGVTAMGVKQIVLFGSWRVDKSYWQSPLLQSEQLYEQLLLGLEQGRDTVLPEISLFKRFKPFVEDHLPELIAADATWLAHPGSAQSCPGKVSGHNTLIVGPEGGFIDYEINKLVDAGCTPVQFGERPLRVETAVPALLGRLAPF